MNAGGRDLCLRFDPIMASKYLPFKRTAAIDTRKHHPCKLCAFYCSDPSFVFILLHAIPSLLACHFPPGFLALVCMYQSKFSSPFSRHATPPLWITFVKRNWIIAHMLTHYLAYAIWSASMRSKNIMPMAEWWHFRWFIFGSICQMHHATHPRYLELLIILLIIQLIFFQIILG